MRLPQSYDDRTLLEDEPFRSAFAARPSSLTEVVADDLPTKVCVEAAQAWLDLAFYASHKESKAIQSMKIEADHIGLAVFTEFYRLLYDSEKQGQKQCPKAMTFLMNERSKRGFRYLVLASVTLNDLTPDEKFSTIAEGLTVSRDLHTSPRESLRSTRSRKRTRRPQPEDGYDAEGEDDPGPSSSSAKSTDVAGIQLFGVRPAADEIQLASQNATPPRILVTGSYLTSIRESRSSTFHASDRRPVIAGVKRKATKEQPSSSSQTSNAEDTPAAPSVSLPAGIAPYTMDSDSSLTSLSSDDPPTQTPAQSSPIIQSTKAAPRSMDSDSSLTSLSSDDPPTQTPAQSSPIIQSTKAAPRRNPKRLATGAQLAQVMMTTPEQMNVPASVQKQRTPGLSEPVPKRPVVAEKLPKTLKQTNRKRLPGVISSQLNRKRNSRSAGNIGNSDARQTRSKGPATNAGLEFSQRTKRKRLNDNTAMDALGFDPSPTQPPGQGPTVGQGVTDSERPPLGQPDTPDSPLSMIFSSPSVRGDASLNSAPPACITNPEEPPSLPAIDSGTASRSHTGDKDIGEPSQSQPSDEAAANPSLAVTSLSPSLTHDLPSLTAPTVRRSGRQKEQSRPAVATAKATKKITQTGKKRKQREPESIVEQEASRAELFATLRKPKLAGLKFKKQNAETALVLPDPTQASEPVESHALLCGHALTAEGVDTVICGIGADAHAELVNPPEPADIWEHSSKTPTRAGQDEVSDEEVSLREAMLAKRAVTSRPSLPTDCLPPANGLASTIPHPQILNQPRQKPIYVEQAVPAIRPLLPVRPPIWAESRQEVCESFDWFRSYQGGVYFLKDLARGYLLSAFSASRDIFRHEGRLIVSHGGGKAESIHKNNGQSEAQQAADQLEEDKSVRALLRNYQTKRPLVLLIDDKYTLFPFDLASNGYTYVVLGFYRIAHAWAEYQPASNKAQVVRYKFAFQWCQEQGRPWWCLNSPIQSISSSSNKDAHCVDPDPSKDPVSTLESESSSALHEMLINGADTMASAKTSTLKDDDDPFRCQTCHFPSFQVYEESWMCLRPRCKAFWTTSNGSAPPDNLTYTANFQRLLSFPYSALEDLKPPSPALHAPQDGVTTSRHFCKGWHCANCGRLTSRYKWEHWECRSCGTTLQVPGRFRMANEFRSQTHAEGFDRHWRSPESGIITGKLEMKPFNSGRERVSSVTFILPYNRGRIHLVMASQMANATADEILDLYQREAANGELKFRRWPLRSHKCRGSLLTNYFSQNTGEPYQYVGGTDNTVPWEVAPTAIVKARDLITLRMSQALDMPADFNEVLSAAYMEKQKMAFHSDSERGLGPVVASLSLGASAYMHFRLHSQYATELPSGSNRTVLSLYLRHGDVLVMEGANVQMFYEHTVVPLNFRIAATARSIDSRNH